MKNKTKVFRIASLLLVLCFISTVMISGTFAKYTSEFSGTDTALVARWEIGFTDDAGDDNGIIGNEDVDLDLFSHDFNKNIVTEDGKKIIAPGVSGEFTLSVTNKSDVAAGVTFAFGASGDAEDVPMMYKVKGDTGAWVSVTNLGGKINELILSEEGGTTDVNTVTVQWEWPYEVGDGTTEPTLEENDEEDTKLGQASATAAAADEGSRTDYILTVTATATQVAPDIEE